MYNVAGCKSRSRLSSLCVVVLLVLEIAGAKQVIADILPERQTATTLNSTLISKVVDGSRNANGNIRTIYPAFGYYRLPNESVNPVDSELFEKFLAAEFQLFAHLVPIRFTENTPYPFSPHASILILTRVGGSVGVKSIKAIAPSLGDSTFERFLKLDQSACALIAESKSSDDLFDKIAIIFVGPKVDDTGACLHKLFLRLFGVEELNDRTTHHRDSFLAELIAIRIISSCSLGDEIARNRCIDEAIEKFSK